MINIVLDNGADGKNRIFSYTADSFTVNNEHITSSIIISVDKLIRNWPPQTFADLATQHIEPIIALEPEVVLLGTGSRMHYPDEPFISAIVLKNIGLEVMDTGAACRSYNLLLSEGRNVVAAMFLQGA